MSTARLELRVHCTPVGMPRPRARAMQTKGGDWVGQVYQPKRPGRSKKDQAFVRAAAFKGAVKDAVWQAGRPAEPWTGPIRLTIDAFFERPKYLQKRSSPEGAIPHTSRPDRDNVDKAVMDALKDVGLFVDDAQVCDGPVRKWWVAKGCAAGVVIVAERIDESSPGGLYAHDVR